MFLQIKLYSYALGCGGAVVGCGGGGGELRRSRIDRSTSEIKMLVLPIRSAKLRQESGDGEDDESSKEESQVNVERL